MTAPLFRVGGSWHAVLLAEQRVALADALLRFVATQRFFRKRAQPGMASIDDCFVSPDGACALLIARIGSDGDATAYTLPVRFAEGQPDAGVVARLSIARDDGGVTDGALVDAAIFPGLGRFLVGLVTRGSDLAGALGRLCPGALPGAKAKLGGDPLIAPLLVEQSHSMLRFGEQAVAKLLRALDPGDDTELEVGRFLAAASARAPVPALLGWVRYEAAGASSTLLVVSEWVENEGTAFELFRRELERALRSGSGVPSVLVSGVERLAARTAELHGALSSATTDPAFVAEPFDAAHVTALGVEGWALLAEVERALVLRAPDSVEARRGAELLGAARSRLEARLGGLSALPELARIRCHGDYHLGQVLSVGGDFVVVDLGGEPLRGVRARSEKHCPLRDVAGMWRSFDYALEAASRDLTAGGGAAPAAEAVAALRRELETRFLEAYLQATRGAAFVPTQRAELERLLAFYALEKCLYEVSYELAQRPAWLGVPLAALERLSQ